MGEALEVLVVDDDPVSVALVTHMLTRAGARVRTLGSGEALLAELAGDDGARTDAVVLDVRLPDGDGRDVVRRLRAGGGAAATVPVVVLTAARDDSVEQTCREAGCDAVLAKPADSATLVATVTTLASGAGSPSGGRDEPLVDDRVLLDRLGDPELVQVTVEVFLEGAPERTATLTSLVGAADPDRGELHRAAHSLKSAADLVGAGPLTRACRELEAVAATEDVAGLRARAAAVTAMLAATCAALREGAAGSTG